MKILMWDVHGGYTDSIVAGTHSYLFFPQVRMGAAGWRGTKDRRRRQPAR